MLIWDAFGEFLRRQPRQNVSGFYCLSLHRGYLHDASANLKGNIDVGCFDGAGSPQDVFRFTVRIEVSPNESDRAQKCNNNDQRA